MYLISYHTTLFETHVAFRIVANMTNNNQGFALFQTIRSSLRVIKTKGIKKYLLWGNTNGQFNDPVNTSFIKKKK